MVLPGSHSLAGGCLEGREPNHEVLLRAGEAGREYPVRSCQYISPGRMVSIQLPFRFVDLQVAGIMLLRHSEAHPVNRSSYIT